MKYALIENGIVTNLIVWDGNTETWQPSDGQTAVPLDGALGVSIGWQHDGTSFVPPAN